MGMIKPIQRFLDREHFTQDEFCKRLGCMRKDIMGEISPQLAVAMQNAFGIKVGKECATASKWTPLQISWAKKFPIRALQHRGYLPVVENGEESEELLVSRVLRFMAVSNEDAFRNYYGATLGTVNPQAYAAWIRMGELCVKRGVVEFALEKKLLLNNLNFLRRNAILRNENLRKTAKEILGNSGIVLLEVEPLVIVPTPICASYWVGTQPVIQIPTTQMTDAKFLEAVFHAVAHIILHPQRTMCLQVTPASIPKATSSEVLPDSCVALEMNTRECEAEKFAENLLLTEAQECELICCGHFAEKKCIQHFAGVFHVRPGILVERLQQQNKISRRSVLNELKMAV